VNEELNGALVEWFLQGYRSSLRKKSHCCFF